MNTEVNTNVLEPVVPVETTIAVVDQVRVTRVPNSTVLQNAKVVFERRDAKGTVVKTDVRDFDQEFLPQIKQGERIKWDTRKQVYPINLTPEKLQELVIEARLTYPPKQFPNKAGEIITKCNVRDRFDAFITAFHDARKLTKEQGTAVLDNSDPLDKIWIAHLETRDNIIRPNGPNDIRLQNAVVTEMLVSSTYEANNKYDEYKITQEVNRIFSELDDIRKKNFCRLCGINVTQNTSHEQFEPLLYAYAHSTDKSPMVQGQTKRDHFLYLGKLTEEDFNYELMVHLASVKGFIKLAGSIDNQYYTLFGKAVGGNKTEVIIEYLRNPQNQGELRRLQEAIRG